MQTEIIIFVLFLLATARLTTKYIAPSVFCTQQFWTPCSVCVTWFALQPAGIWLSVLSPNYSNCLSGALMSPTVLGPDCSSGGAWHSSCTWRAWPQPEGGTQASGNKTWLRGFGEGKNITENIQPKSVQHSFMKKIFWFYEVTQRDRW